MITTQHKHRFRFLRQQPRGSPRGGGDEGIAPATDVEDIFYWETCLEYHVVKSRAGVGGGTAPTVAPGASDLAHAIALAWFPERRRRLERPLLERYHRALCARGVAGYGWADCWADDRLLVAGAPFTPAFQWPRGAPPLVWWANLERARLAFEDLGCEEVVRP